MLLGGCQSKSKEITITEKKCPECGHEVEIFSVDPNVTCEHCGFVVYNDTLSCVQWCEYAKKCVGEKMYESMMEIAAARKAKMQEEREQKKAAS